MSLKYQPPLAEMVHETLIHGNTAAMAHIIISTILTNKLRIVADTEQVHNISP